MRANHDFVGRGWAFPMGAGPGGGIELVSGATEIEAALRMIIGTAPGERVMRPEFGCAIWDHIFDDVEPNVLGLMVQAVREAVGRWEPRIELERVEAVPDEADPSKVRIELSYRVKSTNDRRNLVYPFYSIPKDES